MRCILVSAISIATLSACGGSGTGAAMMSVDEVAKFSDFSSGLNYTQQFLDEAVDIGPSDAAALDVTGRADYSGVMFLGTRTVSVVVDAVVGEMDLAFDLSGDSFAGSVGNFYGRGGGLAPNRAGPRVGNITITNGQVIRTEFGAAIVADVAGQVDIGVESELRDLSGSMAGVFAGDAADLIAGDVNVSYAIDPITTGTLTITEIPLEGAFGAERN